MKKPEIIGGLIVMLIHTLVSGVLHGLIFLGPFGAHPRLSRFYFDLEWWAGSLFHRIMSTDTILELADFLIKRGGLEPYFTGSIILGVLILFIGGAFYFAVGFCGTALFRSGLNWLRRKRASSKDSRGALAKP